MHINTVLAQQHTQFYCLSTITASQVRNVMTDCAKQQEHI